MLRRYLSSMTRGEKRLRLIWLAVSIPTVIVTGVILFSRKEYIHLRMCALSLILPFLPAAVEALFRFRLHPAFYCVCAFYTLTPMMGECWKFYYTTCWWDKMMHTLSGVNFALFGFALFRLLCGMDDDVRHRIAAALLAFCLSVTFSVLWEFVEYTADCLFDMDMQHDTVVNEIHSYVLGDRPGEMGHRTDVGRTAVNGEELPVDGYLDIGLHDTMGDMLFETLGAFITALACALIRLRRPLIALTDPAFSETAAKTGSKCETVQI